MDATSLFNGLSGVVSNTKGMQSVSDNLANLSTYGYKATRTNFEDLLSQQMSSTSDESTAVSQVGKGAEVWAQVLMYQGSLEETGNSTDLAVDGHGFFAVSDPDSGEVFYTRAGNFVVDQEGYLVLPTGHRLMGFGVDGEGQVVPSQTLTEIQIDLEAIQQEATTQVDLVINLSANDTKEFDQEDAIDPSDPGTYNYAVNSTVYDANGFGHDVTTFYQKIDNYTGDQPADTVMSWKAETYEDGAANPIAPDNQFYLHFDSNGHLLGTSGEGVPSVDAYTVDGAQVSAAASDVSNRVGETFSFTGEGDAQEFISYQSADVSGWAAADTLTITVGGAATSYTGLADGEALALAVNADTATTGVWADYDSVSGEITLYSGGVTPAEISGDVTTASNTMQDLIDAVNNGRSAGGTMYIDLTAGWADGDTVSLGGVDWTYDSTGAGDFQDLDELEALITAEGYTVNHIGTAATGSLYIEADTGAAGNSVAMSTTTAGAVALSGATLAGGMDDGATTDTTASAVSSGGGVALHLERDTPGATATLTITGGDLGANLATALDFGTSTQTSVASAGSSGSTEGGEREITFTFTDTDPDTGVITTLTQTVTYDYNPGYDPNDPDARYAGSTCQAGLSSLLDLNSDGSAAGYLEGLEILDDGTIIGIYSNEEEVGMAGVALTDFISPEDLRRESDNLWAYDEAAGDRVIGQPGDDELALGEIESGALEASTVDLASEFVDMITYQRAFQANGKSITTSDEMLQTAINML